MSSRQHGGFSLIEVLAAMVIFSAGAVILFGWIAETAGRLGRLSVEQQSLFAQLTGLEFIRTLNPMQQPSGEMQIGIVRIRWASTPVGDESPVRFGGGVGTYLVRLYQVQLNTAAGDTASNSERSMYLAGWREPAVAAPARPFMDTPERIPNAPQRP